MYATITRLELKSEESIGAAVDALDGLLADARGVAGFRDCYVVRRGPRELTMVTIYDSKATSYRAGEQLRPTSARQSAHTSHVRPSVQQARSLPGRRHDSAAGPTSDERDAKRRRSADPLENSRHSGRSRNALPRFAVTKPIDRS